MFGLYIKRGLLLLLFQLLITFSVGQSTLFLPLIKLETKDGLSSPNVRKIVQDKYGFMWFGTQDGLNRYDGVRFTRFISAAVDKEQAILESDIYDLAIDKEGNYLWCLTAYGGLSKIDIQRNKVVDTFSLIRHPRTQNNLWFKCMALSGKDIFIGTDEGMVLKFDVSQHKVTALFDINQKLGKSGHIDKLYADSKGKIWVMDSNVGVLVLDVDLKSYQYLFTNSDLGIPQGREYQFRDYSIWDDELIISSSIGIIAFSLTNFTIIDNNDFSGSQFWKEIRNGDLYSISTEGDNILITGNNKLYSLNKRTRIIQNIVFSKRYEDRNWFTVTGSIYQSGRIVWIGSQYGVGRIKNLNTPFTAFYESMNGDGTKIQHSITLCSLNDSVLVVCSDDGIYFSNHNTGRIRKVGIPDIYYHAFKGPDDYVIASGINKGLQLADKNGKPWTLTNVFPELRGIQKDHLISSEKVNDSLYFMATQNQKGIYVWNVQNKKIDTINTNSGKRALKSNIVNRLYLDSKKLLWIVGDNVVSIYNYASGNIEHLQLINPATNKPLSINMDICELAGRYWIASYGTGIIELGPDRTVKKIYDANYGINNLGLYKIFPLNDSALIVSSNNGLSVLNIKTEKVVNYFESDGLQSNNFEETSGCIDKNFIFLGGIKGFTKINKSQLTVNKDFPRMCYSSVNIQLGSGIVKRSDLLVTTVEVPNDAITTVVNFSVLDYFNTEQLKFEYNIPEIKDKWSSLDQRTISLAGIPPGQYSLKVRVANEYGDWSDPIELTLIFLPKWYQTGWFKTMVALLLMAILYSLYRYRLAQIRKEQQIRQRIASDLHDDIGSTLNSVKVFTNLALMKPENNITYLQQLKEGVQNAIVGVRDMVWVLDDKQDTLGHLLERIELFISPLASVQDIRFEKTLEAPLAHILLKKEEKRNLYLIIKEALNNSIKYASATTLQLIVEKVSPDRFIITIRDNGKGFDIDLVQKGNGLNNLQYRAQQIKYAIEIDSVPGKGTIIILTRP